MEHGHKVAGGDKLGKTIIFAKNQRHADFIKDRFDVLFPYLKGTFCRVISYNVSYAQDLIDKFSLKDNDPFTAVSVDMLDTGIDVPEVLNLVIFKPVKSKAKFWQMIGRGTRLCPDLYAIGEDKFDFLVFDLCENFEFFSINNKGIEPSKSKSISEKLFQNRVRLMELLSSSNDESKYSYSKDLKTHLIKQTQALDLDSFLVRKHLKQVEKFQNEASWDSLSK